VSIEPGITGLVGENGAGKSTLVKILLGLLDPTEGAAEVMGHHVVRERRAIRNLVGYMPEHDCLPAETSAADFVAWLGRCSGLPHSASRERSAEVLRHVGLFEERYRPMGGYSTGMAQRVKLAQALVHDPRILILDEPTNGLDPAGREDMLALISRTSREFGISVVVSSHFPGELERICDGVILIGNGRLVRATQLGDLTLATGALIVEIDGDVPAFLERLAASGITATRDRTRVVVSVSQSMSDGAMESVCDAVRNAVADMNVGLLRLERHRGRLEDLFIEAIHV